MFKVGAIWGLLTDPSLSWIGGRAQGPAHRRNEIAIRPQFEEHLPHAQSRHGLPFAAAKTVRSCLRTDTSPDANGPALGGEGDSEAISIVCIPRSHRGSPECRQTWREGAAQNSGR